jgi:hypothetical protein
MTWVRMGIVVKRSLVYRLLALGGPVIAMGILTAPAQAYEAKISPSLSCLLAAQGDMVVLEYTLSPSNEATVQAGTPVTFSGASRSPVTFAVASSPALLSSPDIDSGSGPAQPAGPSGGPPTYAFTSIKATATPRTVYWAASFSSAGIPECAGLSATTYTTRARTLTVLPPPQPSSTQEERKAQEERERRERAEREAAERERAEREAREARARECVVPSLLGDSLRKARRVLGRTHCRLGRVSRSHRHAHGSLVVTRQSPRPGSQLAGGARVTVTVGAYRR